MPVKGLAVGAIVVGGVFVWSGVTNQSITKMLQNVLQGKPPGQGPPDQFVVAGTGTGGGPGQVPTSNSAIASDALRYKGAGYVWGGSPANGIGNWDCSSFVNWVTGHDLHLSIPFYPNGSYTGSSHGPTTMVWGAWPGAPHIQRSQVQAGDIVVWPAFHMGIAISNSEMISALNPSQGTNVTPIDGIAPGPLVCLRLFTTGAGGGGGKK